MAKPARKKKKPGSVRKKKSPKQSRGFHWSLWVLLGATFLALSPILKAQFLNYDDNYYITENPYLISFSGRNLLYLFSNFFGNQYAPVAMTIMSIQFKLFGVNTVALKLVSILIHLLNTFLTYRFIQLLFKNANYAIIAALFFALHPLQVEAVGWLTASMKIGTYTAFFLGSLIFYIKFTDRGQQKDKWLSLILFLLSCFCKEQAVSLLAVVILIDYVRDRNLFSRQVLLEKVPYFLITIIFAGITLSIKDEMQNDEMMIYFNPLHRILFSMVSFAIYFLNFLFPLKLSTFYTLPPKDAIPFYYYLAVPFFIAYLYAIYRTWKNSNKLVFFALVFFLSNLFLTFLSQALSIRDVMLADRYIYIPLIGIGLLVAYFVENLLKSKRINQPTLYKGIILVGVLLCIGSFTRSQVWENSITVFSDAIEKEDWSDRNNPYLALVYTNRGVERRANNDLPGALEDYNKALEANPKYGTAYLNRGNAYFLSNQYNLATQDFEMAIQLMPNSARAYSSRGALRASQQNNELALADFGKAIELDPRNRDALRNRIKLYYFLNQSLRALEEIPKYLSIYPGDPEVINIQNALVAK